MSVFYSICSRHDGIIRLAKKIEDYKWTRIDNIEEAEKILYELADIASDIRIEVEQAKESGQKMEDRMSDYKSTIEGLGFVRDKNNTTKC